MWRGDDYDDVASPQFRWGSEVADRLRIDRLDDRPPALLDLGCGSGRVTELLLARHPAVTVVAADKSPSMLARARTRLDAFGDRVHLTRLDLEADIAATVADLGPFDAVFSTGTLHWIRDHRAMYRNIAGLLAPGGALVAQCGGEGSVAEVRAILDDLGVRWSSYNYYAGPAESEQWLRAAGFVDVWTWLGTAPVPFETRSQAATYLLDGVLAPYLSELPEAEQREVADTVASRLEAPTVTFVRLNVLARRG